MKSLLKEIEDKFEEIEESNVTGNLDGGAGPPRTPNAFSKSKDEEDLDDDHIEVLGYKKSKKTKNNIRAIESLERKLELQINELVQNEGWLDKFKKKRSIKGTPDKEPYYDDIADKALLYLQKQDKEWKKYELSSLGPGDRKTYMRMALMHKTNNKTSEPEFKVYYDKNDNIKKVVELEINWESVNEISYKEYKSDDSRHDYQKVNDSIKKINRMMFEMERIINQSAKLKNEAGVHNGQYWKSTQNRFGKISERMLKVARTLKELSA